MKASDMTDKMDIISEKQVEKAGNPLETESIEPRTLETDTIELLLGRVHTTTIQKPKPKVGKSKTISIKEKTLNSKDEELESLQQDFRKIPPKRCLGVLGRCKIDNFFTIF